jgi:hypothetical protein
MQSPAHQLQVCQGCGELNKHAPIVTPACHLFAGSGAATRLRCCITHTTGLGESPGIIFSKTLKKMCSTAPYGVWLHMPARSDLKSRRDRCDCAPTEEDAKRCFILPFDRMAFLEASLRSDGELLDWFRQRLVWSDSAVVNDLLKKGLFMRIYEPQVKQLGPWCPSALCCALFTFTVPPSPTHPSPTPRCCS